MYCSSSSICLETNKSEYLSRKVATDCANWNNLKQLTTYCKKSIPVTPSNMTTPLFNQSHSTVIQDYRDVIEVDRYKDNFNKKDEGLQLNGVCNHIIIIIV